MPRIRFLADTIVETEGYRRGEHIAAGTVREVNEASANRWLRRNLAELVVDPPPPARRRPAPVLVVPEPAPEPPPPAPEPPPAEEQP